MFRKSVFNILMALPFLAAHSVKAQKVGNSGNMPYSGIGIGAMESEGFSRNEGFGGHGVSTSYANYVNGLNPAYLGVNRYTTFEFGARTRYVGLTSGDMRQRNFGGNLSYINLAVPVHKTGSMSFTLKPYSTVRYRYENSEPIAGDSAVMYYNYSGIGGLTAASLSYGRRIGENLFLGATASYIFGNISDETQTLLQTVRNGAPGLHGPTNLKQETAQSHLEWKLGGGWRKKMSSNDHYLNIGATYTMSSLLTYKTVFFEERQSTSGLPLSSDTIDGGRRGSSAGLPTKIAAGASYGRSSRWMAGFDVKFADWTNTYDRSGKNLLAQNTYGAAVFGEYNPSYLAKLSYFSRVIYRGALSYNTLAYYPDNTRIDDIKITLGAGLPLGKQFTNLNVAFDFGQSGHAQKSIRERYFNFHIGVNINDVWFIRRKVD